MLPLVSCTGGPGAPTTIGSTHQSLATATEPVATSARSTSASPSLDTAQQELGSLRVAERVSPHERGYVRDAFGEGWLDVDENGCNQRDDVLLRDAVPGTVRLGVQGLCDHDVLAGSWIDPYTGRELMFDNLKDPAQAQGIQIDHVVPLAEAWVSGAEDWTDERRRAFASDLSELLAVDGPTNASKGDGDPAAWRPRKSFQCEYARRWIGVKAEWDLAIDPSERQALGEMLAFCGS
jgi:hypothetical protein